jgi:hypothetical protein
MGQLLVYVPIAAFAGVIYLWSADISGWFVLAFSTVMAIFFLIKSFTRYSAFRQGERIVEGELLLISYAPFATSLVLIAVLVLLFTDVSKLHLLWFAPLSYVVFQIIFARRLVNKLDGNIQPPNAVLKPYIPQEEQQPRPATEPQKENQQPSAPKTTDPAPRRDRTPVEQQWDKVVWAMRRTKNRKYFVGPILRNVEVPTPADGKISLRFKSNTLKNNFMEEMQDQRSRDALKAAITDVYGSELELAVRSPSEANRIRFPLVNETLTLPPPPDRSWSAISEATTHFYAFAVGAINQHFESVEDVVIEQEQDFLLRVETLALVIQLVDRLSFERAGQTFRNPLLDYLEPFAIAMHVDAFHANKITVSEERANLALRERFIDTENRLVDINQSYLGKFDLMNEGYPSGQEDTLSGVFEHRIIDLFGETPNPEFHRNILWKTTFISLIAECLIESKMYDAIYDAELTSPS